MNKEYEYEFPSIAEKINQGKFCYFRDQGDNKRPFNISVNNSQLLIRAASNKINTLFADLTDIATAVYVADRLTSRKMHKTERILVKLPIRSSELRSRTSVHEELRDLLYWFTEDLWSFEFSPYTNATLAQEPLPWELDEHTRRVALWSGGL